ncbi:hypothetical protein MNBD_NITROSPINAE03-390 [hydrothermal vent metagenome]|uniref:Histidine phosphatase family protein n=1 Tax=hydrothermal vent metagenome TaxID=652676 RepID=A0A3B1C9N7_9ZZZZ
MLHFFKIADDAEFFKFHPFWFMLNIVLIRHGQTEGNADGLIQGQNDTPLTADGIKDTLAKAVKLREFKFNAVYCSDLGRARHTYRLLQGALPLLPEAVYQEELREIDFGEYAGMKKEEIMPTILRHKADTSLKYPGGESGDDLKTRVSRFLDFCLTRHENETVLIVSHYGVIETVLRQFTDRPTDTPLTIDPEAVYQLCFDDLTSAKVKVD